MIRIIYSLNEKWKIRSLIEISLILILIIAQPFIWSRIGILTSKYNENRNKLQQVDEINKRINQMAEGLNKQKTFLNQLVIMAPREKDTIRVIESLETIATKKGLDSKVLSIRDENIEEKKVRGVSTTENSAETKVTDNIELAIAEKVEKPKPKNGLSFMTVSLSINGSPNSLLEYLAIVEHMPALTSVALVNMESNQKLSGPEEVADEIFHLLIDATFIIQLDSDGKEN